MKTLLIVLVAGVISTAPAFADSASVSTSQTIQTDSNIAPPVVAPSIAAAPIEKKSFDEHSVTKSDDGVKRTDEHNEQSIGIDGSSKVHTKTTTEESN